MGRYLETDTDVASMKPINYEVEIYLEQLGLEETVNVVPTLQSQVASSVITDEQTDNVLPELPNVEPELSNESDSEEDGDEFYDSDYDFEEDDKLFEAYVDPDAEFGGVKSKGKDKVSEFVSGDMYTRMLNEEGDDDCVNSDSMGSDCGSDDEHRVIFPKFNPKTNNKNPKLKLGLVFSSKKEAKFAIESHCLRRGMMIKFYKNDNTRLRACCKNDGCKWSIHVSPMQNDKTWQIKTYVSDHNNCYWNYNNNNLKSNWIGKTFMKKFKENPKLGTTEFRNEVCTTLKVSVSKSQAYRAKQKALKAIQGSEEEQFQKIRSYCEELKRTDTNATVVLKLTEDTECLRAEGGQLFAAVGLDPNNNIYPICYAIVEGETKETWMWSIQLLDEDIGFEEQHKWTFMSDKQKGLILAFETLFPGAENRFCVRHLHSNMKNDGFGGVEIKSALWAAAKATRIEEFKMRMEELRVIDEAAYNWLVKKPPQNWTRSDFNPFPKCDILLNNMCECFNSFILDAREKPIIPMLECIRNLLMARMVLNREKALKWDTNIYPKIRTVLIKNMKEAGECIPMKSDEWNFQIMGMYDQHTVDIRAKSCSCRRWDLTCIPCKHVISAIWCRHEDPEQYVHHCYSVDSFKRAYENSISPINGPEFWPQCPLQPPLPPMYTLQPPLPPMYKEKAGRPQKLRRREPDEPPSVGGTKLKGVPRINKCRKCG
ncbi:PREDICTED: uncharacterized protein LOC105958562 [Erythranthe guttata]|uniref:uncharacterized protein LOC105958562 n=1 Tax=Erythranthe guttata TaxID=4155 RepID=UPI00064D9BEC|nr:PREDICTED: uncharacterized protein LOC105958562 [Erythranthe guttata]|eukprot:XP_012838022.1 PREDICTED: uncharacterized protein LOC105958562 [Erythranthe guttata]